MPCPPGLIGSEVTKLAAKLLVLIAVLLMPLGMATAATPALHHQTAEAAPMEHCPDPAPQQDVKGGLAACTMACSAALPAVDLTRSGSVPASYVIVILAPVASLHGIHPETDTPPPRRS